jgi:hypothetical protein
MPVTVIRDLEHYEFACPERVHDRQRHSRHERAEKAPPHRFDTEIVAHFLCADIKFCRNSEERIARRTSMEKRTPPIGEPNATATPAALAAVTISRILPEE